MSETDGEMTGRGGWRERGVKSSKAPKCRILEETLRAGSVAGGRGGNELSIRESTRRALLTFFFFAELQKKKKK